MKTIHVWEEAMEEFEIALADCDVVPEYLHKAISVTKKYPDICNKISWWIDGVWELIEEFLNTHPAGIKEEHFIYACSLLERQERL